MRFQSHPDANCPRCRRNSVWFALKEAATGWKVLCECGRAAKCGNEWTAGRIPRTGIESLDEVSRIAEALVQ
jgi:hypothetical protein